MFLFSIIVRLAKKGQVVAPAEGDRSAIDVDPATWREIDLWMSDLETTGKYVDIDLLEPVSWIAENHAAAGGWIELSLLEMMVRGLAEVGGIEAWPVGKVLPWMRSVFDLQ